MPETLLTLGPLSIHIYGVMIATGLIIALFCARRDKKVMVLLSEDQLYTIVTLAIISGIAGGKLFHLLAHWHEFSSWQQMAILWQEGFWVLGSFVAAFATVGIYLYREHLPVIQLFDRLTLYVPLMFAISRLGCFFKGCCYGAPTDLPWAVTVENIHPTQLYSSGIELLFFLLLFYGQQYLFKKPGQLFSCYLFMMSSERFFVDFFRGDRTLIGSFLSYPQLVALGIAMLSGLVFFVTSYTSLFTTSLKEKKR